MTSCKREAEGPNWLCLVSFVLKEDKQKRAGDYSRKSVADLRSSGVTVQEALKRKKKEKNEEMNERC